MRRTLYTLTLVACILCMPLDTYAQRISHTYNNVSLSEALLGLNNEQREYVINFLYNELEDFRITTTVSRKSVPDAIQQMIGFYPVRMTVKPDDHEIYVECTHKTDRHLTGTIIDEQGQPVGIRQRSHPQSGRLHPAWRWCQQRERLLCHSMRARQSPCPHLLRRLQDHIQNM